MPTLAYLGPEGTNAEIAALTFADRTPCTLVPHHSIQGTLRAVLQREVEWAIVPVENSIEGGVGLTLDCLWNWEGLHIHSAVELPITHALLGVGELQDITHVYSHPQALAQCQGWLELYIPNAQQIPMTSTSVALDLLPGQPQLGAIAAPRAARLKNLPILAQPINDYPDNRTRFGTSTRSFCPTRDQPHPHRIATLQKNPRRICLFY
jgi:prephenate dehydratase